ncbi:MAG TPA: efflux RND transporter periplasmic adaptor subunit [Thermoanaerobacterales bacterium]|nr:efflux RND transporter periplasmic adaptor subunit [Thermoanaerobacterales bacterium]
MKRTVKLVLTIIIIAVVAVYAVFNAKKPLKAELIEVKPQTVSLVFKEEGIVETTLDRPVYATVSGEIVNLAVKEGQRVSRGDLLVQIDTKDMEYQLAQLKAQRKSLEGQEKKSFQEIGQQIKQQQLAIEEINRQLEKSREDYAKAKSLYEAGAISKTELDDAESAVKQLESELSQQQTRLELLLEQAGSAGIEISGSGSTGNAKVNTATKQYFQGMIEAVDAQIKQLEHQIESARITAPIEGVVEEIYVKEKAMVPPQTELMKIIGNEGLEVNAYLLTEDVIYIKEGMKVALIQKRKDRDYKFYGTVTSVAPSAVEKVSALGMIERRVKVTIQPGGNIPELRPGYALDVEFSVLSQENKLAVPKTCLFPYENGDALWIVKDGRAQIRKVTKGMETDELVVIEQGLKPGDIVIKNPQLEGLEQGKRVINYSSSPSSANFSRDGMPSVSHPRRV